MTSNSSRLDLAHFQQNRPEPVIHVERLGIHKADAGTISRGTDALASKSRLPLSRETSTPARSPGSVAPCASDRAADLIWVFS
jgi:hypothetical protein